MPSRALRDHWFGHKKLWKSQTEVFIFKKLISVHESMKGSMLIHFTTSLSFHQKKQEEFHLNFTAYTDAFQHKTNT